MRKWAIVGVVLALVLSLFAGILGQGTAVAKSPKPQDQVKNFMNAAAGLKAAKASGYWVTEERDNVISKITKVPPGTKISISKLKLVVNSQTTTTTEITATYSIKVQFKGNKQTLKNNPVDTFTLSMVNGTWLISESTVLERIAGLAVIPATPPVYTPSTTIVTPAPPTTKPGTSTPQPSPTKQEDSSLAKLLGRAANLNTISYEYIETIPGNQTITSKVWMKKHKMRMETSAMGMTTILLYDLDAKTSYSYTPETNTAMQMPFIEGATPDSIEEDVNKTLDYNPKVIGTETINGKVCTIIAYDIPGEGSIKEWVWQDKGLPMKMEVDSSAGKITMEYSNYSFDDIPDSMFTLPAGVQIMQIPSYGGAFPTP